MLPDAAPQAHGRDMQQLLDDLQQVMDGAFQPSHPGALAHLDPPPLSASIAADLICAGLNNNLLAEELSPSLSHLERQLCAWFAERLGFPEGASGVGASGGTLSNLIALVSARHHVGLDHNPEAVVVVSRAIKGQSFPKLDFAEHVGTHGEVLPLAVQIGEFEVDQLDSFVLDLTKYVLSSFSHG